MDRAHNDFGPGVPRRKPNSTKAQIESAKLATNKTTPSIAGKLSYTFQGQAAIRRDPAPD